MCSVISTLTYLLVVCALANWQMVETWHHGSIFASARARVEMYQGSFWADLLSCPFCLSHWTAGGLTILAMALAQQVCAAPFAWFLLTPALSLAVTRLSNLCNDLTHDKCRTPRVERGLAEAFDEVAKGNYGDTIGGDTQP